MTGQTIRLMGDKQRAFAHQAVDAAPQGYVVKIGAETRRDAQNRKLWALIADIRRDVPDMAGFSDDDIKNRFMHGLGVELRYLPELEGQGFFPVGLKSSNLTVEQFSGLLELVYAYGARHNVRWSDRNAEG